MSAVIPVLLFGGWGSITFILLRFTSSSSLSLLRTLFNISSIFVGFGGSSGTGLYLSGCTTPVGEGRKETFIPCNRLPVGSLTTYAHVFFPIHLSRPLLPFLRLWDCLPRALGAMLPDILTTNAFGVADFSTTDGIIVLLVAHQCVHAQNCWKEETEGG